MILMNSFVDEPEDLKEGIKKAAFKVIESGHYILGPELKKFEEEWAKHCACKYGVGVANGMDAIEIGLKSLGIGPGDEVITTPNTAFATALAVIRTGATLVLADIDQETGLMSLKSAGNLISKNTKAVVLVHLYGQIKSMQEWIEICQDKNIYLIEDCAQAHQSEWSGRPAGSWGDIGSYSFYPTKNLGAMGDAGMIVSNRRDVYENSMILRNYGQTERYYHEKIGFNSRLDEIQAAILNIRLSFLSDFTKRRIDVAKRYNQNINNELIEKLSIPEQDKSHVYHLYVIKTKYRNRLQSFLQENNIQTYIHYPIPVHKQKALDNIKIKYSDLKNSERYANECISIPCNHVLKEQQLNRIIETINSFRV